MGAYFKTSLVGEFSFNKNENCAIKLPTFSNNVQLTVAHSMLKFLESFYFGVYEHHAIYQLLAEETDVDKPARVATICAYDDSVAEGHSYDVIGSKRAIKQFMKRFETEAETYDAHLVGYLVSPETENYIDLSKITQAKNARQSLISPLAMLTRLSKERKGGGDYQFDASTENYTHVGTWYDQPIYYTVVKPIKGGQDITDSVLFYDTWD